MTTLRNGIAPALAVLLLSAGCRDLPIAPKSEVRFDNVQGNNDNQDIECRNQVITGPVGGIQIPPGYNCFITNAVVTGDIQGDRPNNVDISNSTVSGNIEMENATSAVSVRSSIIPSGNIQIQNGASVFITSVTMEHGNIEVDGGSGGMSVQGSRSGFTVLADGGIDIRNRNGSILITSTSISGLVHLRDNQITGTLQAFRNTFGDLNVSKNTITGFFMAADQNRIDRNADIIGNRGPGDKRVQLNTVAGVLSCVRNDPPFQGGPNSAAHTEGQCF